MENRKQQAEELINRYLSGTCSERERLLVERVYMKVALNKELKYKDVDFMRIGNESWAQIQAAVAQNNRKRVWWSSRRAMSIAAVILLITMLTTILYFYRNGSILNRSSENLSAADGIRHQHDITPGGNKAILTLADGTAIDLSSNQQGIIVGSDEIKYADGTRVLTSEFRRDGPGSPLRNEKSESPSRIPDLMSLTTPKGGQYRIILPDGSKVWLNAASTLNYPTKFTGDSRRVELIGEAYFEISGTENDGRKPKNRPFIVKSGHQKITVLGTAFNLAAYPEETSTQTTLVNGRVRVHLLSANSDNRQYASKELTPGFMAVTSSRKIDVRRVDIAAVTSWKNGYFNFNDEDIRSVMLKLSRWYDMEVRFDGAVTSEHFNGEISRNKQVSEVLQLLESTRAVHFKIEGRRVTVMK